MFEKRLVLVDMATLAVSTNIIRSKDKKTQNKLISRADGPICIIILQHHMLIIDKNGVSNAISNDWATLAPSDTINTDLGKGRNAIKGRKVVIEKEACSTDPDGKDKKISRLTLEPIEMQKQFSCKPVVRRYKNKNYVLYRNEYAIQRAVGDT